MLYEGDCLDIMPTLPDKSIDMILCDLPYGTTACKWDTVIPFEPLWKGYKRLIKDNGAIVLTASQPFTSALVMSNPKWFKYDLVWDKILSTGHLNSNRMPLRRHESILIFYKSLPIYNPQKMYDGKKYHSKYKLTENCGGSNYGKARSVDNSEENSGYKYPTSILPLQKIHNNLVIHSVEKPVALFEYLIRTYTNEGDTVLDNCAGSGTTGVACINTNRKYILIEKDAGYCEIIRKRLANTQPLFQEVAI
jgi:site-specific DNA-methyltransferase (adenine-specific)